MTIKYPGVSRSDIGGMVTQEHQAFAGNPIRSYVPVLVERRVKSRLKLEALATAN